MIKGNAPLQMLKMGIGEAVWREKAKLAPAWLEQSKVPESNCFSAKSA